MNDEYDTIKDSLADRYDTYLNSLNYRELRQYISEFTKEEMIDFIKQKYGSDGWGDCEFEDRRNEQE